MVERTWAKGVRRATHVSPVKLVDMKRLVIVESPTKARTIARYLPKSEYTVKASMGHVRDLPNSAKEIPAEFKKEKWANLGVCMEGGIRPVYVIPPDKRKVVSELRKALSGADELLIATDEDREGEAIGWHLLEVLKPTVPVRRMVFHEITQPAIQAALESTRNIDQNLVDAQEARRILDRLVGYEISPVLWKKIAPRLSAGRVQSVAVRLLVEREKERLAFVPASYWDVAVLLAASSGSFKATMTHLNAQRLATGRDFDDNTGRLKPAVREKNRVLLMSEEQARVLEKELPLAGWMVESVESNERMKSPAPPFITSSLQQEASRKFRWGAKKTMQVAQRLYEEGYITYMRTDSVHLSHEAIEASRRAVQARYGASFLSGSVRQYKSKVANAQEAHEAIRPAGVEMKSAREHGLTGDEARLYDLVWKRTMATQMAAAQIRHTTAVVRATLPEGETARFRATGRLILFEGFLLAYVEGSDDPEAALESAEKPLPELRAEQPLRCDDVSAKGHETKAPARYTEAALIRKLEQEGIGRPSTYASIIGTIKSRRSAVSTSNMLAPTFTAFAINNLLEDRFKRLVDYGFTADMEQVLDDIAAGECQSEAFLLGFHQGKSGLQARVEEALAVLDPREISKISFPKWGCCVVRVGRYGPYVEAEVGGETKKAALPDRLLPADATEELLLALLMTPRVQVNTLGQDPQTGRSVMLRSGRYGPYVELAVPKTSKEKPRRTSLLKDMQPGEVTLELALQLLSLPRQLGAHPETGKSVTAGTGRYGPFVKHDATFASLAKEDDVLTIQLSRALDLLAQKKGPRGLLRELGNAPDGQPVGLYEGRYGPYVKHGKNNASIPKGRAPEAVTLDEALVLLAAKAAKTPSRARGRRRRKT